jgi:hypothetical protein
MGDVIAGLAANLEVHMTTLDQADENARKEYAAYLELAKAHRRVAEGLKAVADRMAGYRELPMGKHDMSVLTGPKVRAAFETLVEREQDLLDLLTDTVEKHQHMLLAGREAEGEG